MKKAAITKIIFTALLCVITSGKAMENYLDQDRGHGNIRSEKAIAEFVGKVVAYQFCAYQFAKSYSPWNEEHYDVLKRKTEFDYYSFKDRPLVHYVYIEDKGFGDRCKHPQYEWVHKQLKSEHMRIFGRDYNFSPDNNEYIVHTLLKLHPCENRFRMGNCYYHDGRHYCCSSAFANRCLNPSKSLHSGCYHGEIEMRNITKQEAIDILEVIKGKNAKFSCWNSPEFSLPNILQFLEQLKNKEDISIDNES